MKKIITKVLTLCIILSFVVAGLPTNAYAAAKKVTCVVGLSNRDKAPTLKKGKAYNLVIKKGGKAGIVSFKPTKTKKYSFSVSGYKTDKINENKDFGKCRISIDDENDVKKCVNGEQDQLFPYNWQNTKYTSYFGFDLEIASKKYFEKKKDEEDKRIEEEKKWIGSSSDELDGDELDLEEHYYPITSNQGKVKLKKGQVYYIMIINSSDSKKFEKKGFSCTLKIK